VAELLGVKQFGRAMKHRLFILLVALSAGCATGPSVITKSRAVDIARQNIQYHDGYWWASHAKYSASPNGEGGWTVRAELPDRYLFEEPMQSSGTERVISIDPYGNATGFSHGTNF
jgi:hypothetical protein